MSNLISVRPIQSSQSPPPIGAELREDGGLELREDGGLELRE
jgi:hypothetical protein